MNLTAAQLLRQFAVYGRYYSAVLDGRRFELRSHLEIFEPELGWPHASEADADVVAIMMNPGASRPISALDANGWSPALPDRTQYQLMKLALHAQALGVPIRHIRVINLSDLRTPKSAELFATLKALRDDRHSIFSGARRSELGKALGKASVPVLRAWGLAAPLENWARNCIRLTRSRRVLGLTADSLRYRHPLPQRADLQREWLEQLVGQVQSIAGGTGVPRGG